VPDSEEVEAHSRKLRPCPSFIAEHEAVSTDLLGGYEGRRHHAYLGDIILSVPDNRDEEGWLRGVSRVVNL
jgi:hypothetical protein